MGIGMVVVVEVMDEWGRCRGGGMPCIGARKYVQEGE
jgi:hypothetical protein